jgi:hypothetical protein
MGAIFCTLFRLVERAFFSETVCLVKLDESSGSLCKPEFTLRENILYFLLALEKRFADWLMFSDLPSIKNPSLFNA